MTMLAMFMMMLMMMMMKMKIPAEQRTQSTWEDSHSRQLIIMTMLAMFMMMLTMLMMVRTMVLMNDDADQVDDEDENTSWTENAINLRRLSQGNLRLPWWVALFL